MSNYPTISVIIPAYNVEKYLERCVKSVTNQTYCNLEIILVDDGAKDSSGKICDALAENDSRIKVVHKTNGGLSSARNAGIDIMTGEYAMFIDSDDYIRDDMIEKLYAVVQKNDAQLGICNFLYVDEDGSEDCGFDNNDLPIGDDCISGEQVLKNKLFESKPWYWVVAWNKLYKSELFTNIRFENSRIHEDEFILHKVMRQCSRVACVSEPLYYYVQRAGSIMNTSLSIKRLDVTEAKLRRALDYSAWDSYDAEMQASVMDALDLFYAYYRRAKPDAAHLERNRQLQVLFRELCTSIRQHGKKISLKARAVFLLNYFSMYTCARVYRLIRR